MLRKRSATAQKYYLNYINIFSFKIIIMATTQLLLCNPSVYQYAAGIMRLMLLIKSRRRPQGVPHSAIFSGLHTHTHTHTRVFWTLFPATQICTHAHASVSQSVDDNLVEELRKCFIMQLQPEDIACVPTVHKTEGQM